MDLNGFIMLAGGAWVVSLPFVEIYLLRRGRKVLAAIYAVPLLWFPVGYVISAFL